MCINAHFLAGCSGGGGSATTDKAAEKAAEAVVDAVKDGPFLSVEDFSGRTKVNGTICSLMSDLGLLKDLPQSNQLSLFDL